MSYILDALQKAAAERQRGQVPTLVPPTPWETVSSAAPRRRLGPAGFALLGMGLAAALLGIWWKSDRAPAATTSQATTTAQPPATLPADGPTPAPSGEPAVPQAMEAGLPFQSSAPILAPAPAPATRSAAAPPPAVVPAPATLARELEVSGATYSDNPEHRMLIINGQVVREGQLVRPGLTLEAIGPRSAIFNEGGRRFNLNH